METNDLKVAFLKAFFVYCILFCLPKTFAHYNTVLTSNIFNLIFLQLTIKNLFKKKETFFEIFVSEIDFCCVQFAEAEAYITPCTTDNTVNNRLVCNWKK